MEDALPVSAAQVGRAGLRARRHHGGHDRGALAVPGSALGPTSRSGRILHRRIAHLGADRVGLDQVVVQSLHEPALALGSGSDGLDLTRRLLAAAADHLEENGLLVVEVGNSWPALEQAYPKVAFTWLEFEHGGHGVFALSARELQDYDASWRG